MQDPSGTMEIAEPEENGQSNAADSPVADDPAPDSDIDSATASTVLAEVLPGVAVVFGEVPAELKPDLIDFGLVQAADRMQISTVLASIGNTATVAGNLGKRIRQRAGALQDQRRDAGPAEGRAQRLPSRMARTSEP